MTEPLLHTWNLNLGYAKRLVADIPEAQMAERAARLLARVARPLRLELEPIQ
jgi:hypothetical protein